MTSRHIVLGVTGGIAAYKACTLLRLLRKEGHEVTVIPTEAALEMVGRTTFEALSGNPVYTKLTEGADSVTHVRLAREADLIVIAPATANTIAKLRWGMADNLLTGTVLAASCPVIVVPAMHTAMWLDEATVENVAVLRERGIEVLDVAEGQLTGSDSGPGRMREPEEISEYVRARLETTRDYEDVSIAISAGGTREALDPVRFLTNRSSGRFGTALARAALDRGADVTLVAANVEAEVLRGAWGSRVVNVASARELEAAMREEAEEADILIMAAAVADYRPAAPMDSKAKKTGKALSLELVENPDILRALVENQRPGQIIVGFAAETGDEASSVLELGQAKAQRKGADVLVLNEVGENRGFGDVNTAITLLDATGRIIAQAEGSKRHLAHILLNHLRTIHH